MAANPPTVPSLSLDSCRARQRRLCDALIAEHLEGALITDRRHVHYFTGYWGRQIHSPSLWLSRDGFAALALPGAANQPYAADALSVYRSNDYCTLVDDQRIASLAALPPQWRLCSRVGADRPVWSSIAGSMQITDLMPAMRKLRRTKDADEVALLTFALAASEAAYAHAKKILTPGLDETELWAQLHHLIAQYVGETLGELGNDFQVGALGSAPRRRLISKGETAILDIGVIVRGYNGDMCRTYIVGGEPSREQERAHGRIMESLAFIEKTVEPGTRCQSLFHETQRMLDGFDGLKFAHHLGHGIGLNPHEAPRLNPQHDDTFALGDVFTCEPGLYGIPLRAGIRIEQVYHLTERGLTRLTPSPTDLI